MHHAGETATAAHFSPSSLQTYSMARWPPAPPPKLQISLQPQFPSQPRLSLRWVPIPPPCVLPGELHNWYPFVIWECHTHTFTHSCAHSGGDTACSFLLTSRLLAGSLSRVCGGYTMCGGSRGLKQQASHTPWMENISASTLLHKGHFLNHFCLSLIENDKYKLICINITTVWAQQKWSQLLHRLIRYWMFNKLLRHKMSF